MPTDLTTLTDAQLAERAAACLGWTRGTLRTYAVWKDANKCPRFLIRFTNEYIGLHQWRPATDDAQAAELMRFALAKCGRLAFTNALLAICPKDPPDDEANWLATANARARTVAAIACLTAEET